MVREETLIVDGYIVLEDRCVHVEIFVVLEFLKAPRTVL